MLCMSIAWKTNKQKPSHNTVITLFSCLFPKTLQSRLTVEMGRCVCCLRTWAALISKRSRALTYICIYFSLQSGWCVNERRSVGSGPWFQRHTLPPAKSFFFFLSGLFKRFQENQIEKGENDSSPTKKDDGGQFSVSETPKVVSFLCGSWRPKVWQAPHFIVPGEAASSLEIIAPFSRLRSAVWWLRSNCWHRSWWLMHCDNWLPTFCCFGQTAVAGEGQRQLRTNCVRACVCVCTRCIVLAGVNQRLATVFHTSFQTAAVSRPACSSQREVWVSCLFLGRPLCQIWLNVQFYLGKR